MDHGGRIVEVCGLQDQITHQYPTKIEDMSTVILRFSNGAHGIVDNYFNVPDAASLNRLEIYGTRGSILAEGTIG
jgi:predicted dehydrogenase